MKKIIKIQLYILFLLSGMILPATAQHLYNGHISFPGELVQRNDSMILVMSIDFTNLNVGKNQSLVLTPVLVASGRQAEYPALMINGKVRNKVLRRAEVLDDDTRREMTRYYTIVEAGSPLNRQIAYRAALPYQDWMRGARIDLVEQLAGCGKSMELTIENIMGTQSYDWTATPAYIQPEPEAVKLRDDRFEAYLEFEVSKTEILPNFHNNRQELNTLENGLNSIQSDNNLQVTRISITGYASPEGSVELNNRLSQGRAEALSRYLADRYRFPYSIYNVEKGGEDWAKLERLVAASTDLPAKDDILNIIRTVPDLTERQAQITKLQGGTPYRQLLNQYYPQLRRVLCVVNYTVRDFSVDEARNIIRTNPRQLSLDEMYRVAQSYPQDSQAYNEVFDIAVRTFPDDKTANLNAAANAISRGDTTTARRYLDQADKTTAEYYNNEGVLYLMSEDFSRAEASFSRAAQMGSAVGKQNLERLQSRTSSTQF